MSWQRSGADLAVVLVVEMYRAVEPLLYFEFCSHQVIAAVRRIELIGGALETHRVIVGHSTGVFGTEHGFELESGRHWTPERFGLAGRPNLLKRW